MLKDNFRGQLARLFFVWLVLIVAASIILLGSMVRSLEAAPGEETIYYGGITLEPVQPNEMVELLYQTVDAAIREEAGATFLEITCTFGLHNLSKTQEASVRLGFPTWLGGRVHFDPQELLPISLAVDGQAVTWEKATISTRLGEETRPLDWYVWWIGLARDGQRTATLKYRANLGKDPLPRFAFALAGTGWAGKVGSARVSLHFPATTAYQQLADIQGGESFFDGRSLTWPRVNTEAREEVGASFIKPSLWAEIDAAREKLRQGIDSAQIHYRLGQAYLELAEAEPAFLSEAIAELEWAKELDPGYLEARRALFRLYSSRSGTYLAAAIGEAEVLVAAAAEGRESLQKWLVDAYIKLAADYEVQGQYSSAIAYLDKARTLDAREDIAIREEQAYLGWASQLLQEGRSQEALVLAQEHLKGGAWAQDNFLKPPIDPFQAEVELSAQAKSFHLEMPFARQLNSGNNPQPDFIREAQEIAHAWGGEVALRPRSEGLGLDILIAASSHQELVASSASLAKAFAKADRLKLLAGLFAADTFEPMEGGSFVHEASRLEGKVDLMPLAQGIEAQVAEIEARLRPLQGQDAETRLRRALLERYRQEWLRVLNGSHVQYRVVATTPSGAEASQEFALSLGDNRSFALEARDLRTLAYGLAAGVAFLLAMAMVLLLRRLLRPQAKRPKAR